MGITSESTAGQATPRRAHCPVEFVAARDQLRPGTDIHRLLAGQSLQMPDQRIDADVVNDGLDNRILCRSRSKRIAAAIDSDQRRGSCRKITPHTVAQFRNSGTGRHHVGGRCVPPIDLLAIVPAYTLRRLKFSVPKISTKATGDQYEDHHVSV